MKPGDNWLIPGRKGSGKTTFGKMLTQSLLTLYPTSRLYILDVKMRDFEDYPNRIKSDKAPRKPSNNQQIQVWQPIVEIPDEIEKWLYMIRKDPPAIVQIDELLSLSYGNYPSDEFTRITKLGRALPISTIAQTQELVKIPRGALSQPDHIARFRLKLPYERNLLNNIMGEELKEPEDPYGLHYSYSEKDSSPIYYKDAQAFFGK